MQNSHSDASPDTLELPTHLARRSEWLDTSLLAIRRDLDEDRFSAAMGHFREAIGLCRGLPHLKTRLDQNVDRFILTLLPQNWRIAEVMLQELSPIEPVFVLKAPIREKLNQARVDEARPKSRVSANQPAKSEAVASNPARTPEPVSNSESEKITQKDPAPPSVKEPIVINFSLVIAASLVFAIGSVLVWQHFTIHAPAAKSVFVPLPAETQAVPSPSKSSNGIFQDVPVPPTDEQSILDAVRSYSGANGQRINDDVLDEIDIKTNQASVRYRPKETSKGSAITFSLVREGSGWKVQSAR